MDNDFGLIILFWVIIGALIGAVIGASRNNPSGGFIWGALLGPVGWILVLFLDERPKCPECKGSIPEGARKCLHCGSTLPQAKPIRSKPRFVTRTFCPLCNKNFGQEKANDICPSCKRGLIVCQQVPVED
jgi:predicted amidophosphoribosyltransferase